jgi:hypothetical protein
MPSEFCCRQPEYRDNEYSERDDDSEPPKQTEIVRFFRLLAVVHIRTASAESDTGRDLHGTAVAAQVHVLRYRTDTLFAAGKYLLALSLAQFRSFHCYDLSVLNL